MAIISANVQYNRGEHKLLDYSSLQSSYSAALAWAKDENSNAAVGQFIYIENTEGNFVKGPYVVDAIGENAVLTPLSKGSAGDTELTDVVNEIKTDVSGLKTSVSTLDTTTKDMAQDIKNVQESIAGLEEDLQNIQVPVEDVTVDGVSVVNDGIAAIDLTAYAKSDDVADTYVTKTIANDTYAKASDTYTKTNVDDIVSDAVAGFNTNEATEAGKYVSGISIVDGKVTVSKTDLPTVHIPEYTISGEGLEYQLYKDGSPVDGAVINIPKDMVVTDGEVVELAEGEAGEGKPAGTYIKLTIANGNPLYIHTTDLVDVYTSGDSYIKIDGYKISIDFNTLKTSLITDLNDVYEAKGVAAGLADAAKDAAIDAAAAAVDVKLADYATSGAVDTKIGEALEGYYTKEVINDKINPINNTLNTYDQRLDNLEGLVVGGEGEGIEKVFDDVATLKTIVGAPASDATGDATGLCLDVENLQKASDIAINSIIINGVEAPVNDHVATISLVDNLSNVSEDNKKLPVSAGAVISLVDDIKIDIDSKAVISVVDTMPETLNTNTIYLHKEGETITEKVVVDGKAHVLGSSLYASKALATSSIDGLMSKDDKAKLDDMQPISNDELKGLGII